MSQIQEEEPGTSPPMRFYGAQPLHLMATIFSFAIVAAGVIGWFRSASDPVGIVMWVLACALAFEWILLPLCWALDRLARLDRHTAATEAPSRHPRRSITFVRVPAMLSLLLLIVFAPLIFSADRGAFSSAVGLRPPDYLVRWLLATAAMYGVSAVWYALALRTARASGAREQ